MKRPLTLLTTCLLTLCAAFLIAPAIVLGAASAASEATDLTCELHRTPLGIDVQHPRFSWKMKPEPGKRGQTQTAYRVLVATNADKLKEGRTDVWDSGRIESSESVMAAELPITVVSRTRYYWTVKLWNETQQEGLYAAPTWFETGLLGQNEWKENGAMWIESPLNPIVDEITQHWLQHAVVPFANLEFGLPKSERPTAADLTASRKKLDDNLKEKIWSGSLLRREFRTPPDMVSARLYICGLGYHRAYTNGTLLGERMLPPSDTDFSTQSYYQVHDVIKMLKPNQTNCLAVELVNGRWRAWPGHTPETYHDRPVLLARLEITRKNGEKETIVTDPSWQAGQHGIVRHGFWQGEVFNANQYPEGWKNPGFAGTDWVAARPATMPSNVVGPLAWDPMPPEKVIERGHPVTQTEPIPGVYVYDFGQQLAGRARFTFRGLKKGQRVVVRYSVATTGMAKAPTVHPYYPGQAGPQQAPGMLLFKRRDAVSYKHGPERTLPDGKTQALQATGTMVYTDVFVSAGRTVEVWQPDFTYLGFRFLELIGLERPLPVNDIMGFDLRTTPRIVGSLTTDNHKLNTVLAGIQKTILQGFHSQLQDNNGSERNPNGVNDALNNLVCTYYFDTHPLWTKNLDNLAKVSAKIDWPAIFYSGRRNMNSKRNRNITLADSYHYGQTPLDIVRFYNDRKLLPAMFPWMQKWMQETTEYSVWKGVSPYWDHICQSSLSDLPELQKISDMMPPPMFVQAGIVAKIARQHIELYELLGMKPEAEVVQRQLNVFMAECLKRWFKEGQWLPEVYTRQQILLTLLDHGIEPSLDPGKVASEIKADIATKTGGHQITGSRLSIPLLHVLTQGGQVDEAARLLEREEYPSWLNMIRETGGNIRESWGTVDSFSQIEGLTGAGAWFYRDLVGIEPDLRAPAFKRFILKPTVPTQVGKFDFCYDSPRGEIRSRWEATNGRVKWDIQVPPNAVAEVQVPAASKDAVMEGGHSALNAIGIRYLRTENRRQVFEMTSGHYTLGFDG